MLGKVVGKEGQGDKPLPPFPPAYWRFPVLPLLCFPHRPRRPPPPKKSFHQLQSVFTHMVSSYVNLLEKKESFYIRKTYFDPKGIIIRFRETAYLPLP